MRNGTPNAANVGVTWPEFKGTLGVSLRCAVLPPIYLAHAPEELKKAASVLQGEHSGVRVRQPESVGQRWSAEHSIFVIEELMRAVPLQNETAPLKRFVPSSAA